jgi:hypothetical protein
LEVKYKIKCAFDLNETGGILVTFLKKKNNKKGENSHPISSIPLSNITLYKRYLKIIFHLIICIMRMKAITKLSLSHIQDLNILPNMSLGIAIKAYLTKTLFFIVFLYN